VVDTPINQLFNHLCCSFFSFFKNDSSGNSIGFFSGSLRFCLLDGGVFCSSVIGQPLGSLPRDCNSLRMTRFIQADTEASLSCFSAFLIPSLKEASIRNAICLLPLPLILMVDTWYTPTRSAMKDKCMTSVYQIHARLTGINAPENIGQPTFPAMRRRTSDGKPPTSPPCLAGR